MASPEPVVPIRPSREADWAVLKAVRLQALETEPTAFGSTFARERAFDEANWRSRSASGSMLLALPSGAGRAVGLVGGRPAESVRGGHHKAEVHAEVGVVELVALYVEPEWRGSGLAARLIQAVVDRSRAAGAVRVQLWVAEPNVAAARVYRRCGFVPDGRRQVLPRSPEVPEIGWTRAL